jgi:hypothetical protein
MLFGNTLRDAFRKMSDVACSDDRSAALRVVRVGRDICAELGTGLQDRAGV